MIGLKIYISNSKQSPLQFPKGNKPLIWNRLMVIYIYIHHFFFFKKLSGTNITCLFSNKLWINMKDSKSNFPFFFLACACVVCEWKRGRLHFIDSICLYFKHSFPKRSISAYPSFNNSKFSTVFLYIFHQTFFFDK